MKIVIATSGRFHALDLARELKACGHDLIFFSDLLPGRVRRFGLSSTCARSFFPYTWPFVWAARKASDPWNRERWDRLGTRIRERLLFARLPACEIFISMAGLFPRVGKRVQQKGGHWIIERGSRHVLSQKEILMDLPGLGNGGGLAFPVSPFYEHRNLFEYQNADCISIPARHVAESFLERGVPHEKLFVNPYGVDLEMFPPTPFPSNPAPVILYVGTWSWQKGVDVLMRAAAGLNMPFRLLHVGAVADGPSLPSERWFEHIEPVPQWRLKEYYARGDLFAIASRQEGLALVQAQALACGLPLVCTDRTGGDDLRQLLGAAGNEWIRVVPSDCETALRSSVQELLQKIPASSRAAVREPWGSFRTRLGWPEYGKRYDLFLRERWSAA